MGQEKAGGKEKASKKIKVGKSESEGGSAGRSTFLPVELKASRGGRRGKRE